MRGADLGAAALLAASLLAGPAVAEAPGAGATATDEPLEEIIVHAREPRWVERTRRDRIGRIWAPVTIDGKGPFRFVLDTGATNTAIIARVAEALGASSDGQPRVRLRGVTGTATVPTIAAKEVYFGDLKVPAHRLPVLPDALGGADGILGGEGLADRRVYIDFLHDYIKVSRSHGELPALSAVVVPFELVDGHLLVTDARVGEVRVHLVIDTGAQVSVGNLALRDALRRRHEPAARANSVQGVTLDTEATEEHAVPSIHLGDLQVSMQQMEFADISIFRFWKMTREPTVLVGMDVLGLLDRLVIDYKRRELQMRLVKEDAS